MGVPLVDLQVQHREVAGEIERGFTERAAGEILSLPIFPGITAGQQEEVAAALARALA